MVPRGLPQNKPPHPLAVGTSRLQSDPGLSSSCAEGTNNPSTWGTVLRTRYPHSWLSVLERRPIPLSLSFIQISEVPSGWPSPTTSSREATVWGPIRGDPALLELDSTRLPAPAAPTTQWAV